MNSKNINKITNEYKSTINGFDKDYIYKNLNDELKLQFKKEYFQQLINSFIKNTDDRLFLEKLIERLKQELKARGINDITITKNEIKLPGSKPKEQASDYKKNEIQEKIKAFINGVKKPDKKNLDN